MRIGWRPLAAALVIGLGCGACTRAGSGSSEPAGSRLIISTSSDPKGLNPAFASATPTLELSAFIFSYAVRYDDRAKPVPDAVTEIPSIANGDVSKDGLTLRYKLRRGLKWHDGIGDLQCRDMRATWHMMVNPKNIIDTTVGWNSIKSIDCTNPYLAVVHMKNVYAPFLQQLWGVNGNSPILPAHIIEKYDDANGDMNNAPFNAAPIGSGPYKFVSWQRGTEVRLAANPDYYAGKPQISEIVYRVTPDSNTLATEIATHELGVAWNIPAAQHSRVASVSGITTIAPVIYQYDHLDFNLRRPLLADVRVRRALTYALDRAVMLDKVQHGLGELSDTFLSPTLQPEAYDRSVMHYGYDVAKANALLDAAGWKRGPDGVRVKNGQRFAFQLSAAAESATSHAIEGVVQSYWHAIGAAVEIKNFPTVLFFDQTTHGILAGGKYDVGLYAWAGAPDVDNSAIYSGRFLPPHGQNYMSWQNARATAAMDAANATVDEPKRIALYRTVQALFAEDDPSIILWFRKFTISYRSDLENFSATPVILTPFWNPSQYRLR